MTRKEAIERIKIILEECIEDEYAVSYVTSYDADALDMAIKALKQEPCEDCIDRQAAIDALSYCDFTKTYNDETALYKDSVIYELEQLPSAQPERKKGRWVYNSPVTMKCNQCGLVIKDWDWHRFKFCPNCEADMRGEQE